MAIKMTITKAEFDKLSADMKLEYIADGDNYKLDLADAEDTGALKRAKDRESQLRKDAEKALKEAQEKLDALGTDDARKKGDIETLEKKWKADLDAEKASHLATQEKHQGIHRKNLVDAKANEIATKISKVPSLMARAIRERLSVDFSGDEPALVVLDATGKPSALKLDDLQKEMLANPDYKDIVIVSQASGGAPKAKSFGGAAPSQLQSGDKPADLSAMNPRQLADHMAAVKAEKAAT